MTHYHDIIKKIKDYSGKDFMVINYNGNKISLRVVDYTDQNVSLLTTWRKKYNNMFASVFEISEKRTKIWIKENILENSNCILFLIYVNGKMVGNMGIDKYNEKKNEVELENYMKDPTFNFPGLMTIIERPFFKWMFEGLKLSKIRTHIFSDNYKMLNVHVRCGGWVTINTIPLRCIVTNDGWKWVEIENMDEIGERYFHELELTKENLMKYYKYIDYKTLF